MYLTKDGGLIAGGFSHPEGSPYESNYIVVKLDSSGNIQWDKTIGGSDDDYLRSLQQTNDGGYILAVLQFKYIGRKNGKQQGLY